MTDNAPQSETPLPILYCRCAYAKVVPEETKDAVLDALCASGQPFDTVADLCEMSARRDPALKAIAEQSGGGTRIVACYERVVRGLFRAADAQLPPDSPIEIINMRTDEAPAICESLSLDPQEATP